MGVEQQKSSLLILEMKNITTTLGDSLVDSYKIRKMFFIIHSLARSSNHAPWHLHKQAENRSSHKNLNMMFIVALFLTAKTWKQSWCQSIGERVNGLWYIQTFEYYSVLKRNELSNPEKTQRNFKCIFSSVQSLSCVRLFVTPWITAHQASLFITNSWNSLKLMSIELVMPSSHHILGRSLLLLPPIPPSIRVFSISQLFAGGDQSIGVSALASFLPKKSQGWSPCSPGTLKSLLQHHTSKASILWRSAFFTVQLSHPYMTTGKTIALTRRTLVSKVMSLLLNMLSRLVITFLPRSKRLNFMAAVTICSDFGAPQNKVWHCLLQFKK